MRNSNYFDWFIKVIFYFGIFLKIGETTKTTFVKPYCLSADSPTYEGLSVAWLETEDGLTCDCRSCKYARCTRKCVSDQNCRGVQMFTDNNCSLLYDYEHYLDLPQDKPIEMVSLTRDETYEVALKVINECSSSSDCQNGGTCETSLFATRCNCAGTYHRGTFCDGAENENDPWPRPDGWTGTEPLVYFSLEDVSGFAVYNNPLRVAAPSGLGFRMTQGLRHSISLGGNWASKTCAVTPNSCPNGFTISATLIDNNSCGGYFRGMITSVDITNAATEGFLVGCYFFRMRYAVYLPGGVYDFQTGNVAPSPWTNIVVTYEPGVGIHMYGNNALWGSDTGLNTDPTYNPNTGALALGRTFADHVDNDEHEHSSVWLDNLMIWDRVLTAEERALLVV